MKKLFTQSIVILLIFAGAVSGCKKDSTDTNTTPPPGSTPLCDGTTSTSYFPLAVNDQWKYSGSSDAYIATVLGIDTITSTPYYRVHYVEGSINDWSRYYRVASNGDVYYRDDSGTEYEYVPANPVVNASWAFPATFGIGSRVVVSVNDSVITSHCKYGNCVRINELDSHGNLITSYFYKQGFGEVRETIFTANDVYAVTFY